MNNRNGEKAGWTIGWLGAISWVGMMAAAFSFMGKPVAAAAGAALFGAGLLSIFLFSPWRFPNTPYWRLMLPLYAVFLICIFWVWLAFDESPTRGVTGWSLLWMLPMLMPLGITGRRTWNGPSAGEASETRRNE